MPPGLIALASNALGRAEEWQRLGGTLVTDPAKLLQAGWKPSLDTRAGLATLARNYSRKAGVKGLLAPPTR